MPQTQDRNAAFRDGEQYEYPVAAGALLYAGALAVFAGTATAVQPGGVATNLRVAGVCEERANNVGGAAGAIRAKVKRGVFRLRNSSAGDAITLAHVGSNCFIVDDETVAATNGSSTRSVAGVVRDVDAQGVWVQV